MSKGVGGLADMVEIAGLGPAAVVEVVAGPGGMDVTRVELAAGSARKARTLLRWLDLIHVENMVAGKYRRSDDVLRLTIRGWFPAGGLVAVVAPYSERSEARQTDLIGRRVEHCTPRELVEQLTAIETAVTR